MIAAKGVAGGSYAFSDPNGVAQSRYWIEEIELSGQKIDYGPALVGAQATVDSKPQTIAIEPAVGEIAQVQTGIAGRQQTAAANGQAVVNGSAIVIAPALETATMTTAGGPQTAAPVSAANTVVGTDASSANVAPDEPATVANADVRVSMSSANVTPVETREGVAQVEGSAVNTVRGSREPSALTLPAAASKGGATKAAQTSATTNALPLAAASALLAAVGGAALVRRRRSRS